MAKLKKTLPKNFRELIVAQDWETLKKELLKCEPMAYERGGISHIIFSEGYQNGQRTYLPLTMIRWLIQENGCPVDVSNSAGKYSSLKTALAFYTEKEQFEIVKLLLELGANPNTFDNRPLAMAIQKKNNEILELLLENGAEVNFIANELTQDTLLNLAIFHFNPIAIKKLLKYGAMPEFNGNHTSAIESLLFRKIDKYGIHHNDLAYSTKRLIEPFFLEHGDEFLEIIKLCIEHGADINRPYTKELMQKLHEQFYQCYVNHYFSSPEVEEKMEQFELKLYELMQFEPQ